MYVLELFIDPRAGCDATLLELSIMTFYHSKGTKRRPLLSGNAMVFRSAKKGYIPLYIYHVSYLRHSNNIHLDARLTL